MQYREMINLPIIVEINLTIDALQMNHTVLICLDYYLVNKENYRQ